jgi:hypothetical protein
MPLPPASHTTAEVPPGVPDYVVKHGKPRPPVPSRPSFCRETGWPPLHFPRPRIFSRKGLISRAAPLVYLYSKEAYLPSDIDSLLAYTVPCDGAVPLPASQLPAVLTLSNLDRLNAFADNGTNVFLKSKDDMATHPLWVRGMLPDAEGRVGGGAKTCCVIVADKGNGVVDAFWMFFYGYNYGGTVLSMNLGIVSLFARGYTCSP